MQFGDYPFVDSWQTVGSGTPDYFNTCSPSVITNVPNGWAGYQQAFSGNAYMGLLAMNTNQGSNLREYIATELITPLVAGKCYKFYMHVSLLNTSGFAISNLGAQLSNNLFLPQLDVTKPQIENNDGNYLSDTSEWMLVEGYYRANGGEKYLIIGNFRTDDSSIVRTVNSTGNKYAYYAIDDVNLFEDTILSSVALIPVRDTLLCSGDSLTITSSYTTPTSIYEWSNGSISPSITIRQSGTYILNVNDHCSEAHDTVTVNFLGLPVAEIGSDAIICSDSSKILQANNVLYTSYLWQDGSMNNSYYVNSKGLYILTATNICGTDIDSVLIDQVDCDCNLFFPNCITPNADDLNEEFFPKFDCPINKYSLYIFNRWGEVIFTSENPSGHWDGKSDGKNVHDGVYPFICDYTTFGNIDKRVSGTVAIIR